MVAELTVGLLLALGLALAWRCRDLPAVTQVVRRAFWCPVVKRNVVVEFQEEVWDGRPVEAVRWAPLPPPADVACCSAFPPPMLFGCGKACLRTERVLR